jgi:threonine dehydrogenase-like Zn-dependent dehydrogenase
VEVIRRLTSGIGVDRAIDAVGVEAETSDTSSNKRQRKAFQKEVEQIAPKQKSDGDNWKPAEAPSQALQWAVDALCKAGTLSIIGVYPPTSERFPIGIAMNKNLTIKMGNCNHRRYIPRLIELVSTGIVDPLRILTNIEPLTSAIEAYKQFDLRK